MCEIELLVYAGFTIEHAIKIGHLNAVTYLGRANRVGSIAVGKQGDVVMIAGDPTANVSDIRNVETVFKQGVGYDPARLIVSAQESRVVLVGPRDPPPSAVVTCKRLCQYGSLWGNTGGQSTRSINAPTTWCGYRSIDIESSPETPKLI
jgi:hypothetical protein